MKRIVMAIVLVVIAINSVNGDETMAKNDAARISFRFADKEIIVSMVDNSAARSLMEMLPLTLEFQDYAGNEKISSLPEKLDTSDVPDGYDPSVGDLTLYAPWGNLAFFYRDHGYARGMVPLGTIVSGAAHLAELDGANSVRIETVE
jgi:hypothetical protein